MSAAYALQQAVACLQAVEHELLLFSGFWILLGACDDIAVDGCWIWLLATGKARSKRLAKGFERAPLNGPGAIFIATWHEADVIAHTVRHALSVWKQRDFRIYVGCYPNDPATVASVMVGAGNDPRVRIVINRRRGPTTKADCLNAIYAALCNDERRSGMRFHSVILHDAEDMVHPAELSLIDRALQDADFVQIPVRPEPQPHSRWVGGHYVDEFTESHAKAMVVRDALGAALPAAGVGCGFRRSMLGRIAVRRSGTDRAPFSAECLTEDYELGVLISREGGRSRFVRARDAKGSLVATRAYFPASLETSVRQKTRWVHGIAFQSWDRLGWGRVHGWKGLVDLWMALRDRRGPLSAVILASCYALMFVEVALLGARSLGAVGPATMSPAMHFGLVLCLGCLAWRCLSRCLFTAREYGFAEGVYAVLRIPVSNVIAVMAGGRGVLAYVRTLRGGDIIWDKTRHDAHPTMMSTLGRAGAVTGAAS